jgi:hypothetical protein
MKKPNEQPLLHHHSHSVLVCKMDIPILIAVLLALVLGGYFIFNAVFSKKKTQAVEEEDNEDGAK